MKNRNDFELAPLLKFENVAWYENGIVKILDRRIYPHKISYVECEHYQEVVKAIADMVTQSAGPYMACSMGMVLAAKNCEDLNRADQIKFLAQAAYDLSHARPTTSARMVQIVNESLARAKTATLQENLIDVTFAYALEEANTRYKRVEQRAIHLSHKINDGFKVMTQCFPDTVIGMLCRHLKQQNKDVVFYVPETRPYFQGSRLTASVIADMGFEVYVITDNMIGITMSEKQLDLCLSAADVITQDGHVINKIGTFNIALAAWYHDIPYYCLGVPSSKHQTVDSVTIEERHQDNILKIENKRYVHPKAKGYYPLFDITPPKLVSGIVTENGIISPFDLIDFFEAE